jgi:3'(2'), 5'-bisphosphate nucleotidase
LNLKQVELASLITNVGELARQAGQKIMSFYQPGVAVERKKDESPLTAADRASHDFLAKSLERLSPDVPVISEESDEGTGDVIAAAECFWLVDPLDGTKEFIKGTNEFTVNIALIEAGRPLLGVVHAPALNLTFSALRTSGAWRQNGSEPPTAILARKADAARMSIVASKDHAGPLVETMRSRLPNPQLQSMGSSLKFCLVAEGKADLYLRDLPTMEWDTAAAQCVVEAAGGGVYLLDGKPLVYGKPGLKNGAIMTVGDVQYDWSRLVA